MVKERDRRRNQQGRQAWGAGHADVYKHQKAKKVSPKKRSHERAAPPSKGGERPSGTGKAKPGRRSPEASARWSTQSQQQRRHSQDCDARSSSTQSSSSGRSKFQKPKLRTLTQPPKQAAAKPQSVQYFRVCGFKLSSTAVHQITGIHWTHKMLAEGQHLRMNFAKVTAYAERHGIPPSQPQMVSAPTTVPAQQAAKPERQAQAPAAPAEAEKAAATATAPRAKAAELHSHKRKREEQDQKGQHPDTEKGKKDEQEQVQGLSTSQKRRRRRILAEKAQKEAKRAAQAAREEPRLRSRTRSRSQSVAPVVLKAASSSGKGPRMATRCSPATTPTPRTPQSPSDQ
jgi:hypothetical protein